jgi:hypothetical protein
VGGGSGLYRIRLVGLRRCAAVDDRDGATDIDAAGQLAINVLDERGTSPFGAFRTWRDVRLESVIRTKADIDHARVAMARWLSLRHADGTLYITNRPERERDVLAKVRSLRSTGKPSTLGWQR